MTSWPLMARRRSNENDKPRPIAIRETVGLFDASGFWSAVGGVHFELPLEYEPLMEKIARLANAAYEQGRQDARQTMREALGLDE